MLRIKKERLILILMLTLVIFVSIILFLNFKLVNEIRQYVDEDSEIFKIVLRYVIYSLFTFIILVVTSSYFISSYIYTEMKSRLEIDHLTGLYSRKKLNDDIDVLIFRKMKFAVCYIDFVGFKKLNDTKGHDHGDHVLKKFAEYMLSLPCEYQTYRVGGDEFIVIIKGSSEETINNDLLQILEIYKSTEPNLDYSFNIGISFYPSQETNKDKLIKRADTAMYRAKERNIDYFISKK